MGFTPMQIDEMSLWEFAACAEGYRKANSSEPKPLPPTPEEFAAGVERHLRLTTKH